MTDRVFEFLKRYAAGENISRRQAEGESDSLPYTEGRETMAAWNRVRVEDFIESIDPHNTTVDTKFRISAKGEAAYQKELAIRKREQEDALKKMRVDGLQVQLLELSIQTAKSTLETNTSVQDLNIATRRSLRVQMILAGAIAFFTATSLIVSIFTYKMQTTSQPASPPGMKKIIINQPSDRPSAVPPKANTAKDSV